MIKKLTGMTKNNLIIPILLLFSISVNAQVKKQESGLKREVTLYNPYKPALPDSKKKSYLPDMNDTSKVRPDFHYDVKTTPFLPEYTISPIKAAVLTPDPLQKLYKSYINMGVGNYLTPLAEISISNERSKSGAIGFYARHFSTNGKLELANGKKIFAGFMDNDASLYGRKFFRKNVLEGSLDYTQKSRYAYGYNPLIADYSPAAKEIRIPYNNAGGKVSFSSLTLDSTDFSYDFRASFNYFTAPEKLSERKIGFTGSMSKMYGGFYIGSGLEYDNYKIPDLLSSNPKYIVSVSPFLKKSTNQWSFKAGLEILLDRNLTTSAKLHVYPDINFNFYVIPEYVNFFAGLSGKLDKNEPLNIISENPYLMTDGRLLLLPNTSHDLIISTGLKGKTGLTGNYVLSASYSLISNMLFYTNQYDLVSSPVRRGNYFSALVDDVELFNIHAEIEQKITDKISLTGAGNYYKYTLSRNLYAWNMPGWDATIGLKYNLRDKIIAGVELSGQGKRRLIINGENQFVSFPAFDYKTGMLEFPAYVNLNLNAEYRYSKILSFWAKANNLSNRRYFEWIYYPCRGPLFMIGFTYSL